MIHEAFKGSYIAQKYYEITKPEKNYSREQARLQFIQDNKKDISVLKQVLKEIYKEQEERLTPNQTDNLK